MKLLHGLKKGDIVSVSIDITGRKYTDEKGQTRIFNSIRPYQLRKLERQQAAAPVQQPVQKPIGTTQTGTDNLPF
jgi:single-stranded DNA-binding protein